MTREEAITVARSWMHVRKEVRRQLIAAARDANPVDAPLAGVPTFDDQTQGWPSNDIRKLWQFPSDLSEERLLALIDSVPQ